ncbi:MAG: SDR family oxidoreductase [Nitrosospira sp.]|nr:SDR family oxidoreductase [Nitrosospira sp.]MDN5936820.1 SDR family oxidoreductase [Nitrosospira sp.]
MSTILITGASGFIGSHLAIALADAGHRVVCAIKKSRAKNLESRFSYIPVDYTCDFDVNVWETRLEGVDVAINAVGILREQGRKTFAALHDRAPRTLFEACAATGVKVVQISALGADEQARSRYHLSKKAADDALLSSWNRSVVVQPSLVYGSGGASARLFNLLASLPIIPVPGRGDQRIQPIHIDDLTDAVVALVETDQYLGCRVPLVGPQSLTLQCYLNELRLMMGMGAGTFLHIPLLFIGAAARVSQRLGGGLMDVETWQMLQRGNTADASATRDLLGREPRPVSAFVSHWGAKELRLSALSDWLQFILRAAIAAVWLVAGVVSMGIYPVDESYALLARVGITGGLAPMALYGAAALDIAFGLGTLFLQHRKFLWIAQATLIGLYTVTITFFLPEFWLHPFGPLIKNLPILAAIWLLYEMEKHDTESGR